MKNLKSILGMTLLGMVLGSFWNVLQTHDAARYFEGGVHGAIMSFFLGVYYIFQKKYLRPHFRKIPFWLPNIFNSVVYFFLILFGRSVALVLYNKETFNLFVGGRYFYTTMVFAISGIIIFSLMSEVISLIGKQNFMSLLTGEYLRAKERERIVMFLDMSSSTKIAEEIGDSAFIDLLNDFFFLMEKPLKNTRGRIYKYIGDEAIITWNGKKENASKALDFYVDFKELIQKNEEFFIKNFGVFPKFKAGIHCGKVIIREIGGSKKEIALIGDSLNTASRVLSVSKKEKKPLLLSEDFKKLLQEVNSKYEPVSVGHFELRGKEKTMELFEI